MDIPWGQTAHSLCCLHISFFNHSLFTCCNFPLQNCCSPTLHYCYQCIKIVSVFVPRMECFDFLSALYILLWMAASGMVTSRRWEPVAALLLGFWLPSFLCQTPSPAQDSKIKFRLAGYPRKHNEGRIEVFYQGEWGTICDDDFTLANAEVLCRQLGFVSATAWSHSAKYGAGTGEWGLLECQLWQHLYLPDRVMAPARL